MTLEIKLETATCLCKLLRTLQRPQFTILCYSTLDLVKLRRSPNAHADTDHSS